MRDIKGFAKFRKELKVAEGDRISVYSEEYRAVMKRGSICIYPTIDEAVDSAKTKFPEKYFIAEVSNADIGPSSVNSWWYSSVVIINRVVSDEEVIPVVDRVKTICKWSKRFEIKGTSETMFIRGSLITQNGLDFYIRISNLHGYSLIKSIDVVRFSVDDPIYKQFADNAMQMVKVWADDSGNTIIGSDIDHCCVITRRVDKYDIKSDLVDVRLCTNNPFRTIEEYRASHRRNRWATFTQTDNRTGKTISTTRSYLVRAATE